MINICELPPIKVDHLTDDEEIDDDYHQTEELVFDIVLLVHQKFKSMEVKAIMNLQRRNFFFLTLCPQWKINANELHYNFLNGKYNPELLIENKNIQYMGITLLTKYSLFLKFFELMANLYAQQKNGAQFLCTDNDIKISLLTFYTRRYNGFMITLYIYVYFCILFAATKLYKN